MRPLDSSTANVGQYAEPVEGRGPVLLYDGVCGLCNASVSMVLRHDRQGTLRFAALQSSYGEAVKARHPELASVDSIVFVEQSPSGAGGRRFVPSGAAWHCASV